MTTHAIQSDLMDHIIKTLDLAEKIIRESQGAKQEDLILFGQYISHLKSDINEERAWVVISVLHPSRLVEKADDPLAKLAWEKIDEVADKVANNQGYDDELDLAIKEAWEEILEEQK